MITSGNREKMNQELIACFVKPGIRAPWHYTPKGYIVTMEFHVHFCPRISAFSRRKKMHLNGVLLIGTEFFKIIVPL